MALMDEQIEMAKEAEERRAMDSAEEPVLVKVESDRIFESLPLPPPMIDNYGLSARVRLVQHLQRTNEWKGQALRAISNVKDDFLGRIGPWIDILANLPCDCGGLFNVEDQLHADAKGNLYIIFACDRKICVRPFHVPHQSITPNILDYLAHYEQATQSTCSSAPSSSS